jgi:hypothetical protein
MIRLQVNAWMSLRVKMTTLKPGDPRRAQIVEEIMCISQHLI